MKIKQLLFSAVAGILVGSASLFLGVFSSDTSALYSSSQINDRLYGGVRTAYNWDQSCYNGLQNRLRAGDAPRAAVNNAPSYRQLIWVSERGNPSTTAPIDVDYGQTTVRLQLNLVQFLCAALVQPDRKGASFSRTFSNGVITSTSNANDRRPNAVGGGTNQPALTNVRYRINSGSVSNGGGVLQSLNTGGQVSSGRDSNSRYWFSPVSNFQYYDSGGITEDKTITLRLNVTPMVTFYSSTHACVNGGVNGSSAYGSNNYNRCNSTTLTLTINVELLYKYDLTPTIEVDQSSIESGGSINATSHVLKPASDTESKDTRWQLTRLQYAPGAGLNASSITARNSSNSACGAFTSNSRQTCQAVQNSSQVFRNTDTQRSYVDTNADNLPIGTRICFVTSVNTPTQSSSPVWGHSDMRCTVVAKKPKVQILGGDIFVGRAFAADTNGPQNSSIQTGLSTKNISGTARIFGSWGEYGAVAPGSVINFGTGSAFAGSGLSGGDVCEYNALTFVNVALNAAQCSISAPELGNYSANGSLPDVGRAFPTNGATMLSGTVDVGGLPSGVYTANTGGTLTISGGSLAAGRSVIINAPESQVIIAGDVRYDNSALSRIESIPQLVIIANDISIEGSVNNIDAWLVASGESGTITTCSDVAPTGRLTGSLCNQLLTVNGPVIAKQLYLQRTFGSGSGAATGNPAEVFNLRPDAYLWGVFQAAGSGRLQTVYETELPPRY